MAAVLTPSFPHDILHNAMNTASFVRMERNTSARPSLPSISSLIEDVDKQQEKSPTRSPILDQHRRSSAESHGPQPPTPDRISFTSSPRNRLPPTPPLPGTSSFDFPPRPVNGTDSPRTNGNGSNGFFGSSTSVTNSESHTKRTSSYPPLPESNHWSASASPASSRRPSDERSTSTQEVNGRSQSAYPDPSESNSPYSGGLSQQRPLPANFPPPIPTTSQNSLPIDPQMSATYQHHHHYPVSNGSPYIQSTDRYQCPTCSKAFSRPSSLKIHSYSHTGEKPFKCKFDGCGKEFSVRSNMKRHEKGCHGIETSSAGGSSPKAS